MELKRGAGTTIIWNVAVSLRGGEPESMTRTVTVLVVAAKTTGAFQTNCPLVESMVAPAGEASRLKVSAWAGRSGSLAPIVNTSCSPVFTIKSPGGTNTGG